LLGWSQDELAKAARVGLSTVRELESLKRPGDTKAAADVRRALENEGVQFLPSGLDGGPGVRIADNRPTLLRPPTVVMRWEGVPFDVAWQGRSLTVFVSREVLEDLGGLNGKPTDRDLLDAFEGHRAEILEAVAHAVNDPENFDQHDRLHVRSKDIPKLNPDFVQREPGRFHMDDFPPAITRVRLSPLPRRIWRGRDQAPQDDIWQVETIDREKGFLTISNWVTGHMLPLYAAHIRCVGPGGDPAPDGTPVGLMELTVRLVLEDGHARLELLRDDGK
jgi:hypothetical protein